MTLEPSTHHTVEHTAPPSAIASASRVESRPANAFSGVLDGLEPGMLLSWGLLEVLSLFPARELSERSRFVAPLESLKLVKVPTYGTVVLRNTATQGTLIAPMHIGFFQEGAQNHATSRVLLLEAGELLEAQDCFCIQQSQGGLLKEAQQRFLMLPLGLRRAAFEQRTTTGYSRLWGEIETFSRRYGISRGGHLERFFRPYFDQLLPLRHALETQPNQVGAAYFIGGRLAGIEVAPTSAYWRDIFPILTIYCYGPTAIMAERRRWEPARQPVDLEGLRDIDDLERRLHQARERERTARIAEVEGVAQASWSYNVDEDRHGLRVLSAQQGDWQGQLVRSDGEAVYLSLYHDVTAQPLPTAE